MSEHRLRCTQCREGTVIDVSTATEPSEIINDYLATLSGPNVTVEMRAREPIPLGTTFVAFIHCTDEGGQR